MRHNDLLELVCVLSDYVDRDGSQYVKSRMFGTASFKCVDAQTNATFRVSVFHMRSGQGDMAIPGKDKDKFKMKVFAQVFQKLYGDASTLAADTLSVLVGDQNMDESLVKKALEPIKLDESVGIKIINPTGVRGDGLGRVGQDRGPQASTTSPRDRPRPFQGRGLSRGDVAPR